MPEVTVRHPDDSTETIPETTEWTRKRQLGNMRRARITVERSLAESVSLTEKRDIIELGDIDTLVLVDIENGEETWTLVCYSFEWLANRQPFTAGGQERSGTDDQLATTSIGNVPEWTAGTVSSFTGPMNFVFNHAHEHDVLRRIERNAPGELRFRDEGTVDYVDSLGTDKSGSVELSPDAGTIEDAITITKRGRELDGTHIRVLGAHEGEAQISANLVPDGDPNTYENEVRYSTSRWNGAEDTDWDRWENKEVSDQDTIEEEAAALGDELTEPLIEAETTVVGPDIEVGDWVTVVKDDADLNRSMRVHRITTESSGATRRDKVLLSTRTTLRKENTRQLRDIQQFNTGFQGSSVAMLGGPLEKAIDAGDPVTLNFRYPDIEFENAAELHIRGQQYRIDSQGAAAGGDHTHTVEVTHPTHDHDVTINATSLDNSDQNNIEEQQNGGASILGQGTWEEIDSFTPSSEHSWLTAFVNVVTSSSELVHARIYDGTEGEYYPDTGGHPITTDGSAWIIIAKDVTSNSLSLELETVDGNSYSYDTQWWTIGKHTHDVSDTETSDTALGTTVSESSDASGDHVHDPQPGIYETFDTPSNVDVLINGSTVATDVGSGTFETVIDISDELNPGQWNDITLTSDTLGLIGVTSFIRGYDQIGKQ
jgi:hypothetical protein